MNIAKKLLFGLLLGGALFATACGDSGEKAGKGETCTAEKKCDTNLVCDADATDNTKGVCKEKYEKTKCDAAKGAEMAANPLKDQQSDGKYCKVSQQQPDPNVGGDKIAVGQSCDAAGSKCVDGAECVKLAASGGKTCEQTCTVPTNADDDVDACPAGKKKCKAAADPTTVNVCQAA